MPPVRLDIQVSETGAPLIGKLAASVAKLGPQAQQASGAVQQLGTASQTSSTSAQHLTQATQQATDQADRGARIPSIRVARASSHPMSKSNFPVFRSAATQTPGTGAPAL